MKAIRVSIDRSGAPGRYDVDILQSPVGEASATVALDVGQLMEDREAWQQAILLSSIGTRRIVSELETVVREVGQELFEAVFGAPAMSARYRSSVDHAANRGEPLQVVLRISAPELTALPWEAMYDPHTGTYVSRVEPLVRHVPVASAPRPLRVQYPVRILGITASPRGLPALDVEVEEEHLTRALEEQVRQGRVELHWIRNATWDSIHDTLLSEPWHIVHFIGHGDFDAEIDEGVIALVGASGRAHHVEASRFADLLHEASPMPRLLVLNSCKSGQSGSTDLFSGTASALVRGGVGAVVAMQFEITDPAAAAFARGFYSAIAAGRPVDEAVRSGRVSILGLNGRTLEWVTPILYVRGHENRLFTVKKTREPVQEKEPDPAHSTITAIAERAAAEQAEREQAEREQAEREQAEREQAEREQAEREQAEREQAEREQAEREQAEREQIPQRYFTPGFGASPSLEASNVDSDSPPPPRPHRGEDRQVEQALPITPKQLSPSTRPSSEDRGTTEESARNHRPAFLARLGLAHSSKKQDKGWWERYWPLVLFLSFAFVWFLVIDTSSPPPSSGPPPSDEPDVVVGEAIVGISQFVEHPSLDAAREGFVAALEEGGYTEGENLTLDLQNASGDQGTSTSIASNLAGSDADLVLAIATPSAQGVAQAVTDRPVLFTAVTDPVEAGLVESLENPGGNVTGTTDMNPVAEQIALIKQLDPEAKSVGIIYSSGETNSQVQVDMAKEAAAEEGLEVVEKAVTNTSEVAQAAESFDTDAIYVPTDNKVVSGLEAVISAAEAKQIPLIAGEGDSVERGALITKGIDYEQLGRQTGEMAVRILTEGADPATMPVELADDPRLVVNLRAAERMGVEVPHQLRNQADRLLS